VSLIGLMFLICALASAILTVDRSPWEQGSFVTFLVLSVAAFVVSSLQRPSLLWAVIDDLRAHRQPRLQTHHAHSIKGE
jgi:hypothetical protein